MSQTAFFRLLLDENKEASLACAVDEMRRADGILSDVYLADPASFSQVPGSPFAYWVSESLRQLFSKLPPLEANGRGARSGGSTKSDFRFLRAWWEVSITLAARTRTDTMQGRRWVPFEKGGSFAPYYRDWELVIDWQQDGEVVKQEVANYRGTRGWGYDWSADLKGHSYYFRYGLTWPRRTQGGLSVRVLQAGCVFGDKGPAIFAPDDDLPVLLALTNSAPFRLLVSLQMTFGSYEVGVIQRTPVPHFADEGKELGCMALSCVALKQSIDTAEETSHIFTLPGILRVGGETLAQRANAWTKGVEQSRKQLAGHQAEIDDIAFRLYGIEDDDRRSMQGSMQLELADVDETPEQEGDGEGDDGRGADTPDSGTLVIDLLSYAVGCAVGRWDVRLATGERAAPELPDPFAPLPLCSPGMLTGEDGLPPREAPPGYLLAIDEDGILPDDPEHAEDIVRRVRAVLELLWPDGVDAIEAEACSLLGVKSLRDYLRNPTRGFFDAHIKRYSRSRRKAPVYWLLQSPRKLYGLWVYYHRLDGDLLFKALTNYVEPKITRERNWLDDLRAARSAAGSGGAAAKSAERAIDRQEVLLADLHEFRDKLAAAAHLGLEPDLNDGVLLTIAPLREIVPWKEARTAWDELVSDKYGWSSIGQQMQAKGLIRASARGART